MIEMQIGPVKARLSDDLVWSSSSEDPEVKTLVRVLNTGTKAAFPHGVPASYPEPDMAVAQKMKEEYFPDATISGKPATYKHRTGRIY